MNKITLTPVKKTEKLPLGKSKFFGNPDLYNGFSYPISGGKKLNFLCQINCEEVSAFDNEHLLPMKGMMYFFCDFKNPEIGATVIYYDREASTLKAGSETDAEMPIIFGNGEGPHFLIGEPSNAYKLGFDDGVPEEDQMLLQVNSKIGDEDFDFGGNSGFMCYFIKKNELDKRKFDGVFVKATG